MSTTHEESQEIKAKGAGEWVYKAQIPHTECPLPSTGGIGQGSIWSCWCGKYYVIGQGELLEITAPEVVKHTSPLGW